MGKFTDHARFKELLSVLRSRNHVAECLYYPGMTEVPKGYDSFANRDASAADLQWEDVCPAYALALVSHQSYRLPQDESDMEVLWDELGGNSTKLWVEVRDLVLRAWDWLSEAEAVQVKKMP